MKADAERTTIECRGGPADGLAIKRADSTVPLPPVIYIPVIRCDWATTVPGKDYTNLVTAEASGDCIRQARYVLDLAGIAYHWTGYLSPAARGAQ